MRLPGFRRAHRWIAISSALVLASSACTGLLWAYSPYLYWDEGYMREKVPMAGPAPAEAVVPVREAIASASRAAGRPMPVSTVVLRSDFGRLLWEVQFRAGEAVRPILVDAISGEVLSPLKPDQAALIAGQYVRGKPPVDEVVFEDAFVPRQGNAKPLPAYRVRFLQEGNTEIAIHRDSGQIVADENTRRRFHFAVLQLHQLNYFGFKKTLTALAGAPLLLLVATGLVMWIKPRIRRAGMTRRTGEAKG